MPTPGIGSQILRAATFVVYLGLAGTLLATLLGWTSWWWRPGDLASHFRVQYVWACLIGALVLLAGRHWLGAAFAAVPMVLNLAVILPLYFPTRAHGPVEGPTLRLASINVYSANRQPADVLEFVRSTRPNLVLLMEVTGAWRDVIEALADEYPYSKVVLRPDNFGIALLSRIPFEEAGVRELGNSEVPSIIATLVWSGEKLTVIGTHPLPPGSDETWRLRNDQFQALAELCRATTGPVILAGDLNSTSWSAHFGTLLNSTRLRDSRLGFGVQISWPVWPPLPRIPIDHCLVSPELIVRNRFIGPNIGSDHYPLVIDLALDRQAIQQQAAEEKPPAQRR